MYFTKKYFKMLKKIHIIIILILISSITYSQSKQIDAVKISSQIQIDANFDEPDWENVPIATDFVQYSPYNGALPSQKTEVKIIYSDAAIYISAICYDTIPQDIYTTLSNRDDLGQADYFGIYLDPYNKGLTAYGFFVTAAGVQVDIKLNESSEDKSWDAVWDSEVKITNKGWQVEMKIPYSALRFPAKEIQSWSLNIYRNVQRLRETNTWNFIDKTKSGRTNQSGVLKNIKNIDPPLRLSFFPYLSSYGEKNTEIDKPGYSVMGGMDVKYGINESFTLDMMLIPDFGQVQADDAVLNLSPYETFYNENRAFFTEGMEIYNRGGIFYSRRIGRQPGGYSSIGDSLREGEAILKNPIATQIINTTKFSGKTNSGFGIGFLNGMTLNTYAKIIDTISGNERKILTEPFTNYNVLAIDQALANNSYISLTNTNMSVFGNKYYSDVTATDVKLRNKKNSYLLFVRATVSQIYNDTNKADVGHLYHIAFNKTNGNFRFNITHDIISNNFNPNDLGYLNRNNIMLNKANISYLIYKPFLYFLYWNNTLNFRHTMLYEPRNYISTQFIFNSSTTLKNHLSLGLNISYTPDETYNYFEPRVEDRVFIEPSKQYTSGWLSSDYRKPLAINLNGGFYSSNKSTDLHQNGGWFTISPRLRLSDKLLIVYSFNNKFDFNGSGYVGKTSDNDTIYFGERDIKTLTNTLSANYIFNNKASLNLRLRHYWSIVDYEEYFTLQNDGTLNVLPRSYRYIENSDINYNAFSVDLIYIWRFLPGSELSLVYNKNIFVNENTIINDFYENFDYMYNQNPHLNSISFKLIYYIDYQYLKR